jgi:DNA polymerase V
MYVVANHVLYERDAPREDFVQLDLFTDAGQVQAQKEREEQEEQRERSMQRAMLDIRSRFGKNAILKGMNFSEGATTILRNGQVGGHKA